MHHVVLDLLDLDRLEGAQADVQGDPLRVELGQELGREVEARRRRGDRALLRGVDGLVALSSPQSAGRLM
jgi:hypothetical protein